MSDTITNSVEALATRMRFDYIVPDVSLVEEALGLSANHLDTIHNTDLSKYIVVLGQYLVMLQYNENLKVVSHMVASRNLESAITKARISKKEEVAKIKTAKEQRSYLIMSDDHLQELEERVATSEAEKLLMSNMVKAVSEFLNALKKEKSGRDYQYGRQD